MQTAMGRRFRYRITPGCVQCGACIFECAAGAIRETDHGFRIEPDRCVGCGRCYDACAFEAIERVGTDTPPPVRRETER